MSLKTQHFYTFGRFRLEPEERVLTRDGSGVPLTPKAFDLLLALVEHHGHLLEKDHLMNLVWPDAFVEESNLTYNISVLRKALGDEADSKRFIETVPKRGYRFAVQVEEHRQPRATAPSKLAAISTIGLLSIAVLALWFFSSRTNPPPTDVFQPVPLTAYPGAEIHPSFSPDGTQVAFAWNGENEDQYDIYVKLIGPGRVLPLTHDPADDISPVWSPDGRWIAFVRRAPRTASQLVGGGISPQGRNASVLVVPALGGEERRLGDIRLAGIDTGPYLCWSGDGSALIMADRPSESEPFGLFVLGLNGGEKRRLTSSPSLDSTPAMSPDGRTLAFSRGFVSTDIYLLSISERLEPVGQVQRLTLGEEQQNLSPTWAPDGRSIVFTAGAMSGRRVLWRVSLSGRDQAQPLKLPAETVTAPVLARGTPRLAYVQEAEERNIWRLKLPGLPDTTGSPEILISSTRIEKQPQFSPDGARIAFGSNRSGTDEIWVADSDGANAVQLTAFSGPPNGSPRWSPDGRRIVFDAFPRGFGEIYVVPSDGGEVSRLTNNLHNDASPSWSHDGRWIYFKSRRSGEGQVWKIPADRPSDETEAVQMTANGAGWAPFESKDGKFVFYLRSFHFSAVDSESRKTRTELWRVPTDGGEERKVLDGLEEYALTNHGIFFLTRKDLSDGGILNYLPFSGGKIRAVATFQKPVNHLTASPDGQWILYSQSDQSRADLMLVENFQ